MSKKGGEQLFICLRILHSVCRSQTSICRGIIFQRDSGTAKAFYNSPFQKEVVVSGASKLPFETVSSPHRCNVSGPDSDYVLIGTRLAIHVDY